LSGKNLWKGWGFHDTTDTASRKICVSKLHPLGIISKCITVPTGKRIPKDDRTVPECEYIQHSFEAPVSMHHNKGILSPSKTINKGNSMDRAVRRQLEWIQTDHNLMLGCQQSEINDALESQMHACPWGLLQLSGLDVHTGQWAQTLLTDPNKIGRRIEHSPDSLSLDPAPRISLRDLNPAEVKHRTGYEDIVALFSTISSVCGGKIEAVHSTVSTMTWFYVLF
jgi:hypothetical protein